MANPVQFARGPKSVYSLFTDKEKLSKIYFAEDTKEIIVRGIVYAGGGTSSDAIVSVLMDIPGQFTFISNDGTITYLTIPTATSELEGLLSKEDKLFLDSIPELFVTKDELDDFTNWNDV